jgi:hypothetical protein
MQDATHSKSGIWELVWGRAEVDPDSLARALECELESAEQDFRTRLLIRDSTKALEEYWGASKMAAWLSSVSSKVRTTLERIRSEDLGAPGFSRLKEQLMEATQPEAVNEFLRELGMRLHKPATFQIGGSIALILSGFLNRATTDIDLVDEVPEPVRNEHDLLSELQTRYQLSVTHFQSHFLPSNWCARLQFYGSFGSLQVYLVDVYDVFLGKLFSKRTKDLDDLRYIKSHLDRNHLIAQFKTSTCALLKDESLKQNAEHNWYVLFGESLPRSGS